MRGLILSLVLGLALTLTTASGPPARAGGATGGTTWAADLPSASGCGRRMLLDLYADGTYLFVQRYLCRPWSSAQLETGAWSGDADGVLLVAGERETRFAFEPGALRYVGKRFGSAGLLLNRLE